MGNECLTIKAEVVYNILFLVFSYRTDYSIDRRKQI